MHRKRLHLDSARPCGSWGQTFAVLCATLLAACGPVALGQTNDYVEVQARTLQPEIVAYASVEPITVLTISAGQTGVIAGLTVVPGMQVRAGHQLAQLTGPAFSSQLADSRVTLLGAQQQLSTADKVVAIERQQLIAQLTTRQVVNQAQGAAAQAKIAVLVAQTRLNNLRQLASLASPSDAIVLAVNASNGSLVSAGQPVLTLQPRASLWIKASLYCPDLHAVHVGMHGSFVPSDGSAQIPVKVKAVLGSLSPGGATSVAFAPIQSATSLLNGESGRITLDTPAQNVLLVPTRALILDQGKWWVMLHTAQGPKPQQVTPGSSEGWDTVIQQGLQSGAQVIVENAYLLFHSAIANSYQIPD